MSEAQRAVNIWRKDVIEILSLSTAANRLLYQVSVSIPTIAVVDSVRELARDLIPLRPTQLFQINNRWFRETATSFQAWSLFGRDILVIYPAKTGSSSVTVKGIKRTDAITATGQALEIDDDNVPLLLDICEALYYLRRRHFDSFNVVMARLEEEIKRGPRE